MKKKKIFKFDNVIIKGDCSDVKKGKIKVDPKKNLVQLGEGTFTPEDIKRAIEMMMLRENGIERAVKRLNEKQPYKRRTETPKKGS